MVRPLMFVKTLAVSERIVLKSVQLATYDSIPSLNDLRQEVLREM